MKKNFKMVLGALTSVLMTQQVDAQVTKIKDYDFKQTAPIGTFQGIKFREAGLSGLFPIPNTNGKEFWTLSDRGVNVDAANANVAGCRPTYDKIYAFPTYAPKIHRVKLEGDSVRVLQTITIKRPNGTTATGIINPTGFGSTSAEVPSIDTVQSCGASNANFLAKTVAKDAWGIDSEGIAVDKDGNFWICEEGGPTIWKVGKDGVVIARYTPYANLDGHESQDILIDPVFAYRKNNRGFEGITIAPNGKVYAIIQSPILYPTLSVGEASRVHRILEINPSTNSTRMLVYLNDNVIGSSGSNQIRLKDWKIGDMAAINNNEFLVLEAAARGTSDVKRLYKINIANATAVTGGLDYNGNTKSVEGLVGTSTNDLASNSIVPVEKTLVMDLLANGWPSVLDKAEGLAIINDSTIAISNDNDYGQYSPSENGVAVATGKNSHLVTFGLSGASKLNLVQGQAPLAQEITSPNSSTMPYMAPSISEVSLNSLLTVGDAANNGYRMVGIPDGLGAFDNGNGKFTLLMNHELGSTVGIARAHGVKGSFVSKWVINKSDMTVESGSDLIQNVKLWNGSSYDTYNSSNPQTAPFYRFCSADLPATTSLFNATSGKGTQDRIFFNGEEGGGADRALAHIVTGSESGTTYDLPIFGKMAFENVLLNPRSSDKTIAALTSDGYGNQVFVYVGDKSTTGSTIEKAGLTNGKLYGIKVTGLTTETTASTPSAETAFTLVEIANPTTLTAAQLQSTATELGVTTFLRPEDASWNPNNPNELFLATTASMTTNSRLWRIRFNSMDTPTGGTITAVLEGSEGQKMFDNLTVDNNGDVLLQEDPGNNAHIAKMWKYNVAKDSLYELARFKSDIFVSGGANYLTQDEESSGVIDVQDILGKGKYLYVAQVHKSNSDAELVEMGQLVLMGITPSSMTTAKSSSSKNSYVLPVKQGVSTNSILTVGDAAPNGYKMVGIPDGLGAFDNSNGTFTLLMNHELVGTVGINRAHGVKGAFVSKWIINKNDLSVQAGSDLIQNVKLWNGTSYDTYNSSTPQSVPFYRFCSADLPSQTALYNAATGKGTQDKIFFNGEEGGGADRGLAHIVTGEDAGTTYEIPLFGKMAFENAVANPKSQDKTVVALTSDGYGNQVFVYVGDKSTTGSTIEKAGLTNGKLYGIKVSGLTSEVTGSVPAAETAFTLEEIQNPTTLTAAQLQSTATGLGVTTFLRPEDAVWNPSNTNELYVVTTASMTTNSRLWKLKFSNVSTPTLGGTITAVLEGNEGQKMLDNLTMDNNGFLYLQEDPGNNVQNAKIWQYNSITDNLILAAQHDPSYFISGATNYITQDEESSGIIDMSSILGKGKYLFVDQIHSSVGGELVEMGQLNLLTSSDTIKSCLTTYSTIQHSECALYKWFGTDYTTSGVYTHTLVNAAGCDSIVTLNLTIKQPTTSTTEYTTVNAYKWNGTTYNLPGTYTFKTVNSVGCDSVATLQLTFNVFTTVKSTSCNATLGLMTNYIYANSVTGATNYKFKVTNTLTNQVQELQRTSSYFSLSMLASRSYSTPYSVQVAVYKYGRWSPFGDACTINSPLTPSTTVIDAQWNVTLATITTPIVAKVVNGANRYKFEATANSSTVSYTSTSTAFNLTQLLGGAKYATAYSIKVAFSTDNGLTFSDYGTACTITTPAAPLTKVRASQCGSNLATVSTAIYADKKYGATTYKFRINNNEGTTVEHVSANYYFNLSVLTGNKFGKTYTIDVAYSTDNGATYTLYGDDCEISTPAAPLTKIRPSQCNSTIPSLTTSIYASTVSGANKYKFEVVGNNKTRFIETVSYGFRLTSLVGGASLGTVYTVRVAYSFDGGANWIAYGDECTITTPSAPGHVLSSVSSTPISVYPNPFTSTFKVATTFEGLVNVKVMDLTGKLVEQFDVEASELVSKEMGQSYVPGMYQVTVSQDAQIENFKIVKND